MRLRSAARIAACAAGVAALVLGAPASAADHAVELRGNTFQPEDITIAAGDTVVWTNRDVAAPHDITAADGSWSSHPQCADNASMCMKANEQYRRQFPTAGRFAYYCTIHGNNDGSGMAGTIAVLAPGASTTTPTTRPTNTSVPRTSTTRRAAASPSAPRTTTTLAPRIDPAQPVPPNDGVASITDPLVTTTVADLTSTTVSPQASVIIEEEAGDDGERPAALLLLSTASLLGTAAVAGMALRRVGPFAPR